MLKEFRDFAMRGNVMDLAVGVIIGGAFCIFIIIQQLQRFKKKKPAPNEAPVPVPDDIRLLTEIRDELRRNGPLP